MIFKDLLFFSAKKIISSGRFKLIQPEDCLPLPEHLNPRSIPWDETQLDWTGRVAFLKSLFKISKINSYRAVFFQVIASLTSFSIPFLLHEFITRLQVEQLNQSELLYLISIAIAFGISGLINGISLQHYFFQTLQFNQIATNCVNKVLFKHSLKLSTLAKNKSQIGDIVNFMSSDSDAISDSCITIIDLLNSLILMLACVLSLFYYIGWSAVPALIIMILLIPITQSLSKKFLKYENEMLGFKDQRMNLMSQLLNAIRVVKYFVWEKSIYNEVNKIRTDEINTRKKLARAEIIWGLLYTALSTLVLFTALYVHVNRGFNIDLALVFACISLFAIIEDQFAGLSKFISRLMNIFVSIDRIQNFLKSEVVDETSKKSSIQGVEIKDLVFKYSENEELLNLINLNVPRNQSLAIVGPVGCGKSTLLNLILSELTPTKGQIQIADHFQQVAYVTQDPYIINASFKENLIFGQANVSTLDLSQAIHLSALEYDVSKLPAGLNTEIGEKGVNLSGGQKQRVCLARAFLSKADLIVLDDPLSAVDSHTEHWILEKLIFGAWKNKTRIISTHRLNGLSQFDQILFLHDKKYYLGSFDQLNQTCSEFKNFINTHQENENKVKILQKDQLYTISQNIENKDELLSQESRHNKDEDRSIGAIDKSLFIKYIQSLGGRSRFQKVIILSLFLSASFVVIAPMLQKIWLSQISKVNIFSIKEMVIIYGLLGLFTLLMTYLNQVFWLHRGILAGQIFHERMLQSVLNTSIRFFDTTPVGRILQRFSRDIESVDLYLQWSFDQTLHSVLNVLISFFLIIFVLPPVLLIILPILFLYYRLQNDYRRVARELKRMDSLARSPRYAFFKETIQGLSVIRAYSRQSWMMTQFFDKLSYSTQIFYNHYLVNRWFSVRLPLIGSIISIFTCVLIVIFKHIGIIQSGIAGLVTLYAIDFWRHLNWGVRTFSDLETRMTSIERLDFYAQLESEENLENYSSLDLPLDWPKNGDLEFKNVSLRYADHLPLVLKKLSFKINSGMKTGLIGRTGSGKSTILQSVYRFMKIEQGEILMSGVSIHKIPLSILRKNLAVIPQDPSLFMGTLRSNIDRYFEKTDNEIWEILETISLGQFVRNLPGHLDFQISENGSNLSQGQRQLICLARALLMQVKIIFLDEATASVDVQTDAVLQKVIMNSLKGITLITIAHRLSTLDGYDKIINLSENLDESVKL